MKSDIEISRDANLMRITELADKLGLKQEHVEPYGHFKAKVSLDSFEELKDKPDGRMVLVTATTPTPFGEGKTVNTIGITMGLNTIGKNAISCIRQPSMGPVFGIKGGAAGGGYAQVVPMEDFNLHLTGDIHAISSAHNLGSAALDTRVFHEEREGYEAFEKRTGMKALRIDPARITWRRVVDHNDRALRQITIGEQTPGTPKNMNGVPRSEGFDITVGSELMAILALATSLQDMRERFGKVIMAYSHDGEPVTAEDLQVAGSMTAIMKEAIKPTLMQNLEGGASFVHAGPFANIAHGNSSIVSDQIALKLADYVVTEAGFGSDMGFEKYCNIKARAGGKAPDVVALVCSLRGLKSHSGDFKVVAGRDLDRGMIDPNLPALEKGISNLRFHINNVKKYGLPCVVTINRFPDDTQEELDWMMIKAKELGAEGVAISEGFVHGGEGCMAVANEIDRVCNEKRPYFNYLYNVEDNISTKLNDLVTKGYGGSKAVISDEAKAQIALLEEKGYGNLPVCMAKTQLSVSHDPSLKGEPTGFEVPIREVRLSAGAGFVYALCGTIMTMPGLGSLPGYMKIDIDRNGDIVNLS
ncbi:formate--tetrahydrofolate ligase [Parendozoicomonas sp. Alg238-R29]|uniref:formate--tetrahydrofolate ligase n=1 Tax=Parendozoicomonas sp. Alg238-R29 TaxID=2993446 RepID=UPI00248ED735|nr:formate--tetrahydrofolate ligase [Parendozoicomonas sp. Alg238-R29]